MKQSPSEEGKEMQRLKESEASLLKIQDQLLSKIRQLEDTVEFGFSEGTAHQHNKARIKGLESKLKELEEDAGSAEFQIGNLKDKINKLEDKLKELGKSDQEALANQEELWDEAFEGRMYDPEKLKSKFIIKRRT